LVLGEYEYASVQPAAMREERLWPEDDLKRGRLQAPLKGSRILLKRAIVLGSQRLLLDGW